MYIDVVILFCINVFILFITFQTLSSVPTPVTCTMESPVGVRCRKEYHFMVAQPNMVLSPNLLKVHSIPIFVLCFHTFKKMSCKVHDHFCFTCWLPWKHLPCIRVKPSKAGTQRRPDPAVEKRLANS